MKAKGFTLNNLDFIIITPANESPRPDGRGFPAGLNMSNVMPDPVSGTGQARSGIQANSGFPLSRLCSNSLFCHFEQSEKS